MNQRDWEYRQLQKKAYEDFCEAMTQDTVDLMADEKLAHGRSETFVRLRTLISEFRSADMDKDEVLALFLAVSMGIDLRDPQTVKMAALALYYPGSQDNNPDWDVALRRCRMLSQNNLRVVK